MAVRKGGGEGRNAAASSDARDSEPSRDSLAFWGSPARSLAAAPYDFAWPRATSTVRTARRRWSADINRSSSGAATRSAVADPLCDMCVYVCMCVSVSQPNLASVAVYFRCNHTVCAGYDLHNRARYAGN